MFLPETHSICRDEREAGRSFTSVTDGFFRRSKDDQGRLVFIIIHTERSFHLAQLACLAFISILFSLPQRAYCSCFTGLGST
jgi:hypothetical protein